MSDVMLRNTTPSGTRLFQIDVKGKLLVWIGLCGNGELIGPFFFEGNVNGEAYLQMLNNQIVPGLAERYVLQANGTFLRVWWAQNGAPAHRRIMVIDFSSCFWTA